ncbi:MAG TPA: P-loop NTPase [Gemmatimonadaceae bacterium]|nr:P-loop NTPase [Gemmatimonadaceae bacterium]
MQEPTDVEPAGALDADAVHAALADVPYPGLTRSLVSFGMVKHVSVCAGHVKVQLALRTGDPTIPERLDAAIGARLAALGATAVSVVIAPPEPAPAAPAARAARDPWADRGRLAAVTHVIAVGAGKGGVGKSTVAVNLALALAADGLRVGLLDADIYGPSLPILLGIEHGATEVRMTPEKQIIPVLAHGLPFISFGFFLGEGSPAIWRGPMVSKAVKQFARGVQWPALDVLVVDLPPGTGDIPLSLAQAIELSGAVVVTQPQRLAGVEAMKAAAMFAELEVPVLGVVENMSGAFGNGGGRAVAERLGVPLLGEVAFDPRMVSEGDAGTPPVVGRPRSDVAASYVGIARHIAAALGWEYVHDHAAHAPAAAPGSLT